MILSETTGKNEVGQQHKHTTYRILYSMSSERPYVSYTSGSSDLDCMLGIGGVASATKIKHAVLGYPPTGRRPLLILKPEFHTPGTGYYFLLPGRVQMKRDNDVTSRQALH